MMKKSILLAIALLGFGRDVPAQDLKKWESAISIESGYANQTSPLHAGIGAGIHRNVGYGLSIGLDSWLLLENADSEVSYAISARKKIRDMAADLSIGVAQIQLREPLRVSEGPVCEPLLENASFVRIGAGIDLSDKVNIGGYGRVNFSGQEIRDQGYPEARAGIVLRYTL